MEEEVERESDEAEDGSSSGVVVIESISIIISALFVLCIVEEWLAALEFNELNRYINKYVNLDPVSPASEGESESLLSA